MLRAQKKRCKDIQYNCICQVDIAKKRKNSGIFAVKNRLKMKKEADNDWKHRLGMVFSTNPDYQFTEDVEEEPDTLPKNQQRLRVSMERSGRGGKTVTLVKGFEGSFVDMESLARLLKQKCGVGGAAKDGEIIIQGDHRPKVVEILKKEGYSQTKG